MKQCENDINKSIKKLKLLLDDEGKIELENLIDMLEQLDDIRTRNSFNNWARTGLVELDFLKEYFKVFLVEKKLYIFFKGFFWKYWYNKSMYN